MKRREWRREGGERKARVCCVGVGIKREEGEVHGGGGKRWRTTVTPSA
jgi:hypothetical protein